MADVPPVGVTFDAPDGVDPRREIDDGRFNVAAAAAVGFCVLTDAVMLPMVRRTNDSFGVAVLLAALAAATEVLADRSVVFGLDILNRDIMAGGAIRPMPPMLPRLARRFNADIDERAKNRTSTCI